jgi:hypothetical protein
MVPVTTNQELRKFDSELRGTCPFCGKSHEIHATESPAELGARALDVGVCSGSSAC